MRFRLSSFTINIVFFIFSGMFGKRDLDEGNENLDKTNVWCKLMNIMFSLLKSVFSHMR